MTLGIFGFLLLASIVYYNTYRYYHTNEIETDSSTTATTITSVKENDMEKKTNTRQLVIDTIERIGSVPRYSENSRIQFDYQGFTFLAEATEECRFINLIYPWCLSFSKFDIDEFARVRQVVNDMNTRGSATVFYGITDADEVAVHIKSNILFIPEIPNLEDYLRHVLYDSFWTANTLSKEIAKAKIMEEGK